jgi:hypothetical protein
MAVDKLERASLTNRPDERQKLAKDAFEVVKIIPDSVDLASLCKRFENLRYCSSLFGRCNLQEFFVVVSFVYCMIIDPFKP